MLRSLKSGVSGYVRLERRTLTGSLQFTLNGISTSGEQTAVLLRREGGSWRAVRLDSFGAPRYGQTGLIWKFDPRNIAGHTLEDYGLVAVGELQNGSCDLLLCGCLNGHVDADWAQIREAVCRLLSPVRVSGADIPPIADKEAPDDSPESSDQPQILPELSQERPVYPGGDSATAQPAPEDAGNDASPGDAAETASHSPEESEASAQKTAAEPDARTVSPASEECDISVQISSAEPDILDTPAQSADALYDLPARKALYADETSAPTAGDLLALSDPSAVWPESIEPLRSLFFASQPVVPFESDGYVFVRAPLPEETGLEACLVGVKAQNGAPVGVCYAIPAASRTPEPPAGLEDYVWRDGDSQGYWVVCEDIARQ